MRTKLAILCWLTTALCPLANAQGSAFTYQGRLNDGANPASGIYDLRFTLHNASSGGAQQGGALTNAATAVGNGLFTVTLDFGAGVFTGADRWLEISVRSNGVGAFVVLTPRQAVTPTPYAIYAKGANASGLTGTLPTTILNGIYSNPLNFNNGANSFSGSFYGQFFGSSFTGGSFSGDGSGLLNLNASQISEGSFPASSLANAWRIIGNNGTTATNFIGTTENHALDFRVANVRGFRIEPDPRGGNAANIIGGYPSNRIEQPNSGGSIIAGGGGGGGGENIIRSNSSGAFIGAGSLNALGPNASDALIAGGKGNRAASYAAVVGGGFGNILQANSPYSTIGGGAGNVVLSNSTYSTIGGGSVNILQGDYTTIGGGVGNTNTGYAATVAGGFYNTAANNGAFVGGGGLNVASGFNSTVPGGAGNFANEANAVIGGGSYNTNRSASSTIAGGILNRIGIDAFNSFIGGGSFNEILPNSPHGTIPGGEFNAAATHAFAAGRQAKANHTGAFVWSDSTGADFPSVANNEFAVRASGGVRFVTPGTGITLNGLPVLTTGSTDAVSLNNPANVINGTFTGDGAGVTNLNAWRLGGNAGTTAGVNFLGTTDIRPLELRINNERRLLLDTNANIAIGVSSAISASGVNAAGILSGSGNEIRSNSFASVIGGGQVNIVSNASHVVIAGGLNNTISNSSSATISGGIANVARGFGATIGGGTDNAALSDRATVSGGAGNTAIGDSSFVGGGMNNVAPNGAASIVGGIGNYNFSASGFIGGGTSNNVPGPFDAVTLVGGKNNSASGTSAFLGGGEQNALQSTANYATIGGGYQNTNLGAYATIPGGTANRAGADYTFAAGRRAKANHQGAFVWADSQNTDMASTANNQFIVRAAGGLGINTNNPTAALHVGGIPGTDGIRFPNGTLQTTAPVPVFASGAGLNPTTTNQFLAQTVTVTVNSINQRILVTSHKALGSVAVGGASGLNLFIGYRPAGSGVSPTEVGTGTFDNRVPQNTRITMGLSAMITGLASGNYEVGLMGVSSTATNWNSNEFSYTTATVY